MSSLVSSLGRYGLAVIAGALVAVVATRYFYEREQVDMAVFSALSDANTNLNMLKHMQRSGCEAAMRSQASFLRGSIAELEAVEKFPIGESRRQEVVEMQERLRRAEKEFSISHLRSPSE